jgi:hypothetical protein
MTQHLGMPIPSPALMEKISTRFGCAVESFAEANGSGPGSSSPSCPTGSRHG